ncbi:xanthine dehydrogenase family protein molybdopterin-binding subunit [Bacillus spongiae]|uniref:Xanthine dehydrogenase family protein molybdopterin-binding subunit n=1 Tax=Bacillus spongiae TaxID=2683610 RepID=A0ABU8HIK9_9BACI
MDQYRLIGKSIPRKEGENKVTGRTKYVDDHPEAGTLFVQLVTSQCAHGYIRNINTTEAYHVPGVLRVVLGNDFPYPVGSTIVDRPPLAFEKVRYFGEPIAMVIATSEVSAKRAALSIQVTYDELPVVNSALQAYESTAPLVHENINQYKVMKERIRPEHGTNIANRTKVRKGDTEKGFSQSDIVIEEYFTLPQSDHAAMETRGVIAEIKPNGDVEITSASQSPFEIRRDLSDAFGLNAGNIHVTVPLVGGGFGGKTAVQLEILAYLASVHVGGRKVKLRNTREQDFITSPVHIGLEAKVKLGCTKAGRLQAAEFLFLFDGGAYSGSGVLMSTVVALDCTGPYSIEHVTCDSLCMYTNHPYATAFRGFGHCEFSFAVERAIDIIAGKLDICPLEFRMKNAITPGDTTPSQVRITPSNMGDGIACLKKLKELINWNDGVVFHESKNKVRAKGISFVWKNSSTSVNAGAGATLIFNENGSVTINCGAVEIGQGTKTVLAQMVAERLKMEIEDVHIKMEVDTQVAPEHWKTAASRTTYLVGNAVLAATEDAMQQLKETASKLLALPLEKLEIENKKVYEKNVERNYIDFAQIAFGIVNENGEVIGQQVIGRGSYVFEGLKEANKDTGVGQSGPEWGVAAQAVEVEYNPSTHTYKLLQAVCVIDAGKILNKKGAETQVFGAMNMGISFASREAFYFDEKARVLNNQFRSYKPIHFGQQPTYKVAFVETPHSHSPFGSRAIGEHGILGMPAALANSLSTAANVSLYRLPITPESIWRVVSHQDGFSS